jgi:hypothetical protein
MRITKLIRSCTLKDQSAEAHAPLPSSYPVGVSRPSNLVALCPHLGWMGAIPHPHSHFPVLHLTISIPPPPSKAPCHLSRNASCGIPSVHFSEPGWAPRGGGMACDSPWLFQLITWMIAGD